MQRYSKSLRKLPRSSGAFLGFKREVPREDGTRKPHVYLTEEVLLVDSPRPSLCTPTQRPQRRKYSKTRFWR
jgi:hypothetical protein